jgi:hypothetical protein
MRSGLQMAAPMDRPNSTGSRPSVNSSVHKRQGSRPSPPWSKNRAGLSAVRRNRIARRSVRSVIPPRAQGSAPWFGSRASWGVASLSGQAAHTTKASGLRRTSPSCRSCCGPGERRARFRAWYVDAAGRRIGSSRAGGWKRGLLHLLQTALAGRGRHAVRSARRPSAAIIRLTHCLEPHQPHCASLHPSP